MVSSRFVYSFLTVEIFSLVLCIYPVSRRSVQILLSSKLLVKFLTEVGFTVEMRLSHVDPMEM